MHLSLPPSSTKAAARREKGRPRPVVTTAPCPAAVAITPGCCRQARSYRHHGDC
ncbi:uncharacterized protein DS421_20g695180 [Arachis hypogaea]|nr:uncharacterized protein DS421_20g695180 [Arachis hypogaea]